MHGSMSHVLGILTVAELGAWMSWTVAVLKVVVGFSLIIFVHELGHFLAAKWMGVRVDRFAIGFGYRLFGWRRGEGFTFGRRPNYSSQELHGKGYGETDYCFKALPLGGYVKMLGQDDIVINEQTGEMKVSDDPRAFTNKPVGRRMVVVSAGVIFNLLFAVLAYACVYMLGRQEPAPLLGDVPAGSPAARAGLRPGDVVLEANGQRVDSFNHVLAALILGEDNRARFRVQREGQVLPDEIVVQLDASEENPLQAAGLQPMGTTVITGTTWGNEIVPVGDRPAPRVGDEITHVAGQPVKNSTDVTLAVIRHVARTGDPLIELVVKRPVAGRTEPQTIACAMYATLLVGPTQATGTLEEREETAHILGLVPRRKVATVEPGRAGDQAGLRPGDVIAQWGGVLNPRYREIVESIAANPDAPIPLRVERAGGVVELRVTPRRPFHLLGTPKPRVGVGFVRAGEERPVVADVAPDAPAADLNLPRGTLLTTIGDQPVRNWFEVVQALRAAAGQTVPVCYRIGGLEGRGALRVPSSIVNELDLPPEALLVSIAGRASARRPGQADEKLPNPYAVTALLEEHLGRTVRVAYQRSPDDPTLHEGEFFVRPDRSNLDPWQMRINYGNDFRFAPQERTVRTLNPLVALWLGTRQTGLVLEEIYQVVSMIGRGFVQQRSGATRHVAGPVGILGAAFERAKRSLSHLLAFLAFLSVNLAVINFLPFPVVDGGLMVFLLIEKIKGKPLSLKTQMIATLVGLATIILVFVLVTIQDITKLFFV